MSNDSINMEPTPAEKAQSLQTLATGSLSPSLSSLSSSSKAIPSNKDFHFFYNFDEFKLPIEEIASKSQSMLESIGSSGRIWGNKQIAFPENVDVDGDDAYDWLVNVNDELLERFDVSIDEYQRIRKKEKETGRVLSSAMEEDGFQLVYGKKKKKEAGDFAIDSGGGSVNGKGELAPDSSSSGVKVKKAVSGTGKAKVPFHVPTIRKSQEEFNILVNNANQPFEHVWLQRSEDGQRFIHPLEKLSVMDFVDKDIENVVAVKPLSIESTSFKLVEEVKDLKELAAKLRNVNEFAVDLENNQYRSFQGLTCLMQISTRTEDFIVDTLKLRIHVGPYLREVFKDPTKKKVMHGADQDIVWLQRDFGIYICNLFDTGQASRVLKLERNSLEHLLHHYCGVTANKEYQKADWRLRPLPDEMLRYAREDTHYLLYIYDLMRINLSSMPKESEHVDAPLVEVYKQSYNVCMQLYEKEILMENSYLHIYGLQGAGLNAEQLAIVAALYEWRDIMARGEDESTGYILPNKSLLEIAKQMPVSPSKLRCLLKSKHPYVERNLGTVVSIIKNSMQNASAFEAAAQQLRERRIVTSTVPEENHSTVIEGAEVLLPDSTIDLKTAHDRTENLDGKAAQPDSMSHQQLSSPQLKEKALGLGSSIPQLVKNNQEFTLEQPILYGTSRSATESVAISGTSEVTNDSTILRSSVKVTEASIQVLKKPSRGFGALLGSAATKKKSDVDKKDMVGIKLEQIRSSVNLPFYSFKGREEQDQLKPVNEDPTRAPEVSPPEEPPVASVKSNIEDVIMLGNDSDLEESTNGSTETSGMSKKENSQSLILETNREDEPVSLSDLSSSFQKCFQSINQNKKHGKVKKSQEPSNLLQLKSFDYEAARKQVKFGDNAKEESEAQGETRKSLHGSARKKGSDSSRVEKDGGTGEFQQGRRRQAFPASGNRSATFQ
ncbi:hypothetical protein SLEP1_g54944 [Rubroshorea leprosula]|uniref:HRDC domain-containing protein n=1 Tax=Rubroshorea leprosula TaxID=152421 RepID=A0AAV5MER3_9ROSI|nr:hypothetical protein SLEP1_g54944 [Rubroshorea leprosula]